MRHHEAHSLPKVPFAATGVPCSQLFSDLLRTVGSTTNVCLQRIFENHSLKGQGYPGRVANQTFLVFYTPNKPEKANKHCQSDPKENRWGSYERRGVTLPIQLGKSFSFKEIHSPCSVSLQGSGTCSKLFIISNCRRRPWKWDPHLPAKPSLPIYL